MIQRRALLAAGAALLLPACGQPGGGADAPGEGGGEGATNAVPITVEVPASATQGQALNGTAPPGAEISIGELTTTANAQGRFVIGFDRDAPAQALIRVRKPTGEESEHAIAVSARNYNDQNIEGQVRSFGDDYFDLDGTATVGSDAAIAELSRETTRSLSQAQTARIQREAVLKREAFGSRDDSVSGFTETWVAPVQGIRITSAWGASRTLNTAQGRVRRTHYGIDISALTNSEIVAPAAARVVLANDDLYYEGGCVFLDHGQGLVSVYLHMNSVEVAVGDLVQSGQRIGAVGATGRATGPHLCWRMKWRNANLDPTLLLPGGTASLLRT